MPDIRCNLSVLYLKMYFDQDKATVFHVTLQTTLTAPWTDAASVQVGEVPAVLGTPDVYALVKEDNKSFLRIDVYAASAECLAFQEAIAWRDFIVIGYGNCVYLIAQHNWHVRAYLLEGYFGHFYPAENSLFVASAVRLLCIGANGTLRWSSAPLGVDGVIVDNMEGGFIWGQGEWDPPGGWKPFQLEARTGAIQGNRHNAPL